MKKHLFLALLVLTLVAYSTSAFAQAQIQPGNKKPRTLEDYQPRTLKQLSAMEPDAEDVRDMSGRLVVTRDILPSMVKVTYTGTTRSIPQTKKETIRQWARLYAGSVEHYTEPYQSEMLFIEKGKRYWLAIQKDSGLLKQQFKNGATINLYLIRMGATVSNKEYDWTFLVEQFR